MKRTLLRSLKCEKKRVQHESIQIETGTRRNDRPELTFFDDVLERDDPDALAGHARFARDEQHVRSATLEATQGEAERERRFRSCSAERDEWRETY